MFPVKRRWCNGYRPIASPIDDVCVFLYRKQTGGRGSRKRKSVELGVKVSFKTMSEVENMDDGYRWRKYGKKKVKDNQNPR